MSDSQLNLSEDTSDQNWVMTGVDIESRRIDAIGDVCEAMQAIIVRGLLKMSEISKDPIEIYLSTYGGDAYSALAIYDAIRACECDVSVIATGKIMSAGTIIMLAGDYRAASVNTRFMIHSISTSSEGKIRDMDVDLNEAKFLNNKMIQIYTERTRIKNPKVWQKKLTSSDIYFGIDKAVEYGFIKLPAKEVPNVKSKRSPNKRKKPTTRTGK